MADDRAEGRSGLGALIVGQGRALRQLEALLARDHLPSLLFTGQPGVGKRTAALRLAQAANCEMAKPQVPRLKSEPVPCGECHSCRTIAALSHPDIRLLLPTQAPKSDAPEARLEEAGQLCLSEAPAYRLGLTQEPPDVRKSIVIDAVRWIRREVSRPPLAARWRLIIVLHAHRLYGTQGESANALLKTLEEPQERTSFVLVTGSPSQLLDTIRSRCQEVRFADVPATDISSWLVENEDAGPEQAAAAGELGAGSIGRAVRYLRDPEAVLCQPVVDYFGAERAGADAVARLIDGLGDAPTPVVVETFLFLYREALRVRLGIGSGYAQRNPAIARRAALGSASYFRRAIKYLVGRSADCRRYGLNHRLFIYTLVSALRTRSG